MPKSLYLVILQDEKRTAFLVVGNDKADVRDQILAESSTNFDIISPPLAESESLSRTIFRVSNLVKLNQVAETLNLA